MKPRRWLSVASAGLAAGLAALAWCTVTAVRPLPSSLDVAPGQVRKLQVLDRHGTPLNVTYDNDWNVHERARLHEVPELLQQAFVLSEDQRFFRHGGVDWLARLHGLAQNLAALRTVRGASTITEQVVRMLHPRPRTLWSRWVEGLEASALEGRFGKAEILEFYLNQVPYAARRRGVVQAARYYFDRELDTLSVKEILALAVLVRAPGRMDLRRNPRAVEGPLRRLAERMRDAGAIGQAAVRELQRDGFRLAEAKPPVRARHFVRHALRVADRQPTGENLRLRTTLDGPLQRAVQALLNRRLTDLRGRGVWNGAALVVDNRRNEVMAWCVGIAAEDGPGSHYDTVVTPRQPGSTLKPFVYALALEQGWTAATLIDDSPLAEPVGAGLHTYRNYSRVHYGPIPLRKALGNSLNVPAVKAIRFVGPGRFLDRLRRLGFASLMAHPDVYGDGLALGNGEVTLFELVQAYSALARRGRFRPLGLLADAPRGPERRVFSEDVASLIGHILSDPEARRLEFGSGGLLRFPVETAVKTGTSSDYRDAWAVGFNYRYTVGVWMGNVEGEAMDGVTGSVGPAFVLRSIFGELTRHGRTRPLYLSPRLVGVEVCESTGLQTQGDCASRTEWFIAGTKPKDRPSIAGGDVAAILRPADGLQLAMDPRIPDHREAFEFAVGGGNRWERVEWHLDGDVVASGEESTYLWPLRRGDHTLVARVREPGGSGWIETPRVTFRVK